MKAIRSRLGALAVPAMFLTAAAVVSLRRDTFTEFDGLAQLMAGRELWDTGVWAGWPSRFWPPLYGTLAAVPGLEGFAWARIISLIAAAGLLLAIHALVRQLGGSKRAALIAQALLALNPLFFLNAIQAQNHMLDAALGVTAILLLVRCVRSPSPAHAVAAGAVAGLAGLTRYTSYVIPVVAVGALALSMPRGSRLRAVLPFALAFAAVSSPWWIQNWVRNGSPLSTWQHLNVGSAYIDPDDNSARWWWLLQARYHSLPGLIRSDPGAYFGNMGRNLWGGLGHLFGCAALASFAFVPGAVVSIRRSRAAAATLIALVVATLLLVSQAFLRDYLFIVPAVLLTVLAAPWIDAAATWLHPRSRIAVAAGCLGLAAAGVTLVSTSTARWMREFNATAVTEAPAVAAALRADSSGGAVVVATHPIYAYEAGARFALAPLYYRRSITDLVRYAGLSDPVMRYVPRFPSTAPLRAGYLVVNESLLAYLPQYRFMMDPASPRVPAGWRAVYRSDHVVLYAVP